MQEENIVPARNGPVGRFARSGYPTPLLQEDPKTRPCRGPRAISRGPLDDDTFCPSPNPAANGATTRSVIRKRRRGFRAVSNHTGTKLTGWYRLTFSEPNGSYTIATCSRAIVDPMLHRLLFTFTSLPHGLLKKAQLDLWAGSCILIFETFSHLFAQ